MKLTVVLPAYNEVNTIEEIVARVVAVPLDKEVLIIDDGSTDGTREKALAMAYPEVRVLLQDRNGGKGSCVRRGIAEARGDFVVVQDADLEYDPGDLVTLVAAAEQPDVHAALGNRMAGMRARGKRMPLNAFTFGRVAINLVFRLVYLSRIEDVSTCYKIARREDLQALTLRGNSFNLDFELAAKLVKGAWRARRRIVEVPVWYEPRTAIQGKKLGYKDGFEAVCAILRYRFAN